MAGEWKEETEESEIDEIGNRWRIYLREVRKMAWLALPMVFVNVLTFSLQIISVMFVGHLGELPLASSAIASSMATVTGYSVLTGMACALDTFCGQAYGAKQYRQLGVYLQRAVVVLGLTSVFLAIFWANIGNILTAIGQDPQISINAGIYARWLIPSIFAYAAIQPLQKFLQAQSLVFPLILSSATTAAFHIFLCWFMIYYLSLGIIGVALATRISYWVNVVCMLLYVLFSKNCEKTRCAPTLEAFQDLKPFFKLAIPSVGMVCLEMWSYEALTILSGFLPEPELQTSTLSICLNTTIWAFMIPNGLGAAASTRVSNELGAGHPRLAQMAVQVAVGFGFVSATLVSSIFFAFRNHLGYAYSNDTEIIDYVTLLVPWLVTQICLDGVQGVLSGILRGCGWQKAGAIINLLAYYGVGFPLGISLAFVAHLNGQGLWMGVVFASCFQLIGLIVLTYLTNWEKEAMEAKNRVESSPFDGLTDPLLPDVEGEAISYKE